MQIRNNKLISGTHDIKNNKDISQAGHQNDETHERAAEQMLIQKWFGGQA